MTFSFRKIKLFFAGISPKVLPINETFLIWLSEEKNESLVESLSLFQAQEDRNSSSTGLMPEL